MIRLVYSHLCSFFFFQAEDGIRDRDVTGVQTCALPISHEPLGNRGVDLLLGDSTNAERPGVTGSERLVGEAFRQIIPQRKIGRASVGKECRSRWSPDH